MRLDEPLDYLPSPPLDPYPARRNERGQLITVEPLPQHLALVLWALMDPGKRGTTPVAAALLRSKRTIRHWRMRYRWDDRVAAAGEVAQQVAAQQYRERHLHRVGMGPHAVIERLSSIPVLTAAPPPEPERPGPSEVAVARTAAAEGVVVRPDPSPAQAERDKRRIDVARVRTVAQASVGQLARDLQAGKVRVRPSDLAGLHRLIRECSEELGEVAPAGDTQAALAALQVSARVSAAERTGGSVLRAQLDDARELVAILGALAAADDLARERAEAEAAVPVPAEGPATAEA